MAVILVNGIEMEWFYIENAYFGYFWLEYTFMTNDDFRTVT